VLEDAFRGDLRIGALDNPGSDVVLLREEVRVRTIASRMVVTSALAVPATAFWRPREASMRSSMSTCA